MTHRSEINAILKQVEPWAAEEKRYLVEKLAQQATNDAPAPLNPGSRPSLGDLLGIGNPTRQQLTDQEVDNLRYEALREKYKL